MENVNSAAAQSYLVYSPPVARSETRRDSPAVLTPARLQQQMGHLVTLFEGEPAVAPAAPAQALSAIIGTDEVAPVAGRQGKVLAADRFLKADQYTGIHHQTLQSVEGQPQLEGAPNYREVGDKIFGVAQPTREGIKNVLNQAGCGPGSQGKPAIWTNLREEPVVYVNGTPFNLRDVHHPLDNEASPGRSPQQVDQRERELKREVLDEASKNGGFVTLHDEAGQFPNNRIVERKVKVESVETVQEVYRGLEHEGYNVHFQRIPVTDTKKPEDRDLDALTTSLKDADPDSPLIFNCHAGEGRTTTGMVTASLLRRAEHGDTRSVLRDETVRQDIKEQGKHNPDNYSTILKSVKTSEQLLNTEQDADAVITRYGDVHDLKQTILSERSKAADLHSSPSQQAQARQHASDYLERYHTIVSFDQYVQEQGPGFRTSYSHWKRLHPEIQQDLQSVMVGMVAPQSDSSIARPH